MPAGDLVDFTPDEWLAILPAAVAAPRRTPGSGPLTSPTDPAALARSERPLTPTALRREVGALSGHLAAWIGLQMLLSPLNARSGLRFLAFTVAALALTPAPAILNDGRLSTRALACGIAGSWVVFLFSTVGLIRATFRATYFGSSRNARRGANSRTPAPVAAPDIDLGSHPLATIARWKELLDLQGPAGAADEAVGSDAVQLGHIPSELVAHRDGDPMCPCGLQSCSGAVAARAAWSRAAEVCTRMVLAMTGMSLFPYTAAVTFAGPFWSAWWWALLGAFYYAMDAFFYLTGTPGRFSASFPAMGLAEKLHFRAMSLALDSLLDRLDSRLTSTDGEAEQDEKARTDGEENSEELYIRLHLLLSRIWERRIPHLFTGDRTSFSLLCSGVAIAVILNLVSAIISTTVSPRLIRGRRLVADRRTLHPGMARSHHRLGLRHLPSRLCGDRRLQLADPLRRRALRDSPPGPPPHGAPAPHAPPRLRARQARPHAFIPLGRPRARDAVLGRPGRVRHREDGRGDDADGRVRAVGAGEGERDLSHDGVGLLLTVFPDGVLPPAQLNPRMSSIVKADEWKA
ncbi:hypothetical protein DFJ74DRAFT_11622 [Hyaloraphidium curvatum]|nr:hypothetical protein DFJ74DRAFT_11622 [Hyaloraphidium curvatum]